VLPGISKASAWRLPGRSKLRDIITIGSSSRCPLSAPTAGEGFELSARWSHTHHPRPEAPHQIHGGGRFAHIPFTMDSFGERKQFEPFTGDVRIRSLAAVLQPIQGDPQGSVLDHRLR
jgi:hypothetical protein